MAIEGSLSAVNFQYVLHCSDIPYMFHPWACALRHIRRMICCGTSSNSGAAKGRGGYTQTEEEGRSFYVS
jgi:hypothetical protein